MILYVLLFKVDLLKTLFPSPWTEYREDYGRSATCLTIDEQVSLQDGMQAHVVHVGMPQGGVASRKKKYYGFK